MATNFPNAGGPYTPPDITGTAPTPTGALSNIFGGNGLSLPGLLSSIIPIGASLAQYLGSDAAFNNAGNLINTAELGAAGGVQGATGNANDALNALLGVTTSNAIPYQAAGASAANTLGDALQPGGQLNSTLTADQLLQNDPGYQFRLGQGEGDLQSRLASEGLGGSGEEAKQLTDYQQQFASNEFQNAFQRQQQQQQNLFQRLAGTAGIGMQGNQQALTSAEAFGAPQASNLIASSVYGGNAGVTGASAKAGAIIDANQQKNAMIQNIMTALLSLFNNQNSGQPSGGSGLLNMISPALVGA